jgi:hypothetical protein
VARFHKLHRSPPVIKKKGSRGPPIRMQRHGKYSLATPGEYAPKLEAVKERKVLPAISGDP